MAKVELSQKARRLGARSHDRGRRKRRLFHLLELTDDEPRVELAVSKREFGRVTTLTCGNFTVELRALLGRRVSCCLVLVDMWPTQSL